MSDLPTQILQAVACASSLPLLSSEAFPVIDFVSIKSALDTLVAREMIILETIEKEEAGLTDEAQGIVKDGSHEAKVYYAVCRSLGGLKISELANTVGAASAKVGQGKAFKEGWIRKDGDRLVKAVSIGCLVPAAEVCSQDADSDIYLQGSFNWRYYPW